jgi:hypothetical protein
LAASFEQQIVTLTVLITHRHLLLCPTQLMEFFTMVGSRYHLERIAYEKLLLWATARVHKDLLFVFYITTLPAFQIV